MASGALFDLLPDFGSRAPRAGQAPAAPDIERKPEVSPPQADIGALIAEAVADAEAALQARLAAAHEAALEAERIGVRGPLSLFEPLKAALGDRAANLDFTEAPGFDLTVTIDETVFETRIAEWSASLSEVLT